MSAALPDLDMPSRAVASFFIDATPLMDENWTGIPVVCANVSRQLLDAGYDVSFCLGARLLPLPAVRDALDRNTGLFLRREHEGARTPLRWPRERVSVGFSASVKRVRRVFDVECSVIHDISTILQPQYHLPANIAWHTERVAEDVASNDVTFCVSQATLDDLVGYLGVERSRLVLAHNGVDWPWWYEVKARNDLAGAVAPYVVVLSTREPRKNLALVLDALARWPDLFGGRTCVFVGKDGWLLDQVAVPPALHAAVAQGRIVQAGFVSEYEKYLLLRGAELMVFPSLFEGFGLPVLEALSVGTPCVASFSSSIPEIGGTCCDYFDPFSADDLHRVVQAALARGRKHQAGFAAECRAQAAKFSWRQTAATMLAALDPIIRDRAAAAG